MTTKQRVALWDAINEYVVACHGDPSKHVHGNTPRMRAVATVEAVIREVEQPARELEMAACEVMNP